MIQFLFGFLLALLSFHINHKIKKIIDIKILINSLFELYGSEQTFKNHNQKDANNQLMQEIIAIEKMYDDNQYIKKAVSKLIKLRLIYYNNNVETIEADLKAINFKKLGRLFIITSFINAKY